MRSSWPALLTLGVVALDQGTKAWAARTLSVGVSQPLLGDFIRLTRVHNPGGAFGLLPRSTGAFIAVSVVVVVALGWALFRGRWRGLARAGGALLLGGALGNLIDRLRWGYVLDFLELPSFPVFNAADSAIVLGAGLLGLSLLWRSK